MSEFVQKGLAIDTTHTPSKGLVCSEAESSVLLKPHDHHSRSSTLPSTGFHCLSPTQVRPRAGVRSRFGNRARVATLSSGPAAAAGLLETNRLG
jgi:hypothetical protein